MSSFLTGPKFSQLVIRALGLEPQKVLSVKIHNGVGELAHVELRLVITPELMEKIASEMANGEQK